MPAPSPAEGRFWAKVRKTDSCWLWEASCNHGGYGSFAPRHGQRALAHRFAYQLCVGPIPEGMQLDHVCRVRNCVNPRHLEPVTPAENMGRAWRDVTHCKNGHAWTPEDTYMRPSHISGQRNCRACGRENARRYAAARVR